MMDDYFLNSIVETDFCKAKLSLTTNEYSWKIIYQVRTRTKSDTVHVCSPELRILPRAFYSIYIFCMCGWNKTACILRGSLYIFRSVSLLLDNRTWWNGKRMVLYILQAIKSVKSYARSTIDTEKHVANVS